MTENIKIEGARCHNLKNINVEIPKNKITVITGLSGSGKSSLAFDTVYAEGQRRYMESLSAYARQFLEMMEKPDVDYIEGLSPAIAIQQHSPSSNPRSTVGTVTEIYDYLRLLFARAGKQVCHICSRPVAVWNIDAIFEDIYLKYSNKKIKIIAPLISGRTGTYEELFSKLRKKGWQKAEIDGKIYDLESVPSLKRYEKHDISVLVDEFEIDKNESERLKDDLDLAIKETGNFIIVKSGKEKTLYSLKNACPSCALSMPDLEPRLFSFNSPYGACPECAGLGFKTEISVSLAVNPELSVKEGALTAWSNPVTTRTHRWKNAWSGYYGQMLSDVCAKYSIPENKKFSILSEKHKEILLNGDGEFEGVLTNIKRRYSQTESEFVKEEIRQRFMTEKICPSCSGKRLKKEALSVYVGNKNISDISDLTVGEAEVFFSSLNLNEREKEISRLILKEIKARLGFLNKVGLSYLTLSRSSSTLSGGEAQRIRLATQIGSGLTGVLYVLDEPTIGLHQKDNIKLISTLKSLRDLGNTLLIVEHDETVMKNADNIIDMGPGAGIEGGKVIAQGSAENICANPLSVTGPYLCGKEKKVYESKNRKHDGRFIKFFGVSQFNLRNIDTKIPLGLITCVCGVSGSGKSTLVHEIIYKALAKKLYSAKDEPGRYKKAEGLEQIDKAVIVDQSPIGRTPRSNPATYSGVFDRIREVFSLMPEARRRGFDSGRFSFNLKGGRCEACQGDGAIKIQMQFLPDIFVKCEQCLGKRFNEDTLSVKYKDKNIHDVLEMSVSEALDFFSSIPQIKTKLNLLQDVGLGYIKLGQSSTTLSGGEAQRIKLAFELSKRATGKTLYILDEPTTGLHFADVEKLIKVLQRLADSGNTIIVIEHNLDIIRSADWIIELGPQGGPLGGELIYEGYLKEIKKSKKSVTAAYL
ncbi:MAG: excinuclease ABC subunit UvrA [Elusimicrobiota bacterium]